MEQGDLLRYTVSVLERFGFPYLVTGSIASSAYGEPRLTLDIDIVLKLPWLRVGEFCSAFPASEYYVSEDAARQAVERGGQFNIIHMASGQKVDLMVHWRSPLDRARFERAVRLRPAEDYEATFASPEDVILKKMEFYKQGESDKHLRDIMGILKIRGNQFDRAYLSNGSMN